MIVGHVDPSILDPTAGDLAVFDDPEEAKAALGLGFYASAAMITTAGREFGAANVANPEQQILETLAAVAAWEMEVRLAANTVRERELAIGAHQERVIEDTDVLMAAMREVTAYEDPAAVRTAICRIARSLSGADAAALYEFDADGAVLVATARTGLP